MPNPSIRVFVSDSFPGIPGWRRVPYRILLFVTVLVFACCLTARAAVVEAEGVEREVDTPTGVRSQTLDEAAPPPATDIEAAAPGGSSSAAPTGNATNRPQNFEPLPVVTETPTAAAGSEGGGSRILGFLVVGVLVVLVGLFVFAARGRGKR